MLQSTGANSSIIWYGYGMVQSLTSACTIEFELIILALYYGEEEFQDDTYSLASGM
jgi:hypothetical protein